MLESWKQGKASALELALDDYVQAEQGYRYAKAELDRWADHQQDDYKRQRAQESLEREKDNLAAAYADLLISVAENDQSLEERQTNLLMAIANLELARDSQARLDECNPDPEKQAAAEARLQAAEGHTIAAQATIDLYELSAPFDGTLLSFDLNRGEPTLPGVPVAFLGETETWQVETIDLAEIDVNKVSLEDPVIVELDAFPDEGFNGKVIKIDPVGRDYLGDTTYKVNVLLDQPHERFKWNMSVIVTITVE